MTQNTYRRALTVGMSSGKMEMVRQSLEKLFGVTVLLKRLMTRYMH